MEPVGGRALQIRRSPLPRFPLRSRRPKFRGLDTVALRLEVQGLVVRPEEPSCLEAHEEGLARFIGMTGHGWTIAAMHRRSLERFDVDAVLLPYNSLMAQQERYRRNFEEVLDVCRERNVAVQVIKSIARGPWATAARTHTTWYQPLRSRRTSTARSTGSSACRASSSTPPAT